MKTLTLLLLAFASLSFAQVTPDQQAVSDLNRLREAELAGGKNSAAYFEALQQYAGSLFQAKQYAAAAQHYSELLDLSTRLYGKVAQSTLNASKNLTVAQLQLAQYDNVVKGWRQTIAIARQLPGDHLELQDWGERIGVKLGQSNYAEVAIEILDYHIRQREKNHQKDFPQYFWVLKYTRDFRHQLGRDDSLHFYFEEMAAIMQPQYKEAPFNLRDWTTYSIGRKDYAVFDKIESACQKYLQAKDNLQQRDAGYAEALLCVGRLSTSRGQTERAFKAFSDALDINSVYKDSDPVTYLRNLKYIVTLCNDNRLYNAGTNEFFQQFIAAYPRQTADADNYLVNLMEEVRYHQLNGRTPAAIALTETALKFIESHQGAKSQEYTLFNTFLGTLRSGEKPMSRKDEKVYAQALGLEQMSAEVEELGRHLASNNYQAAVRVFERSYTLISQSMLKAKKFDAYVTMLCGVSYCYRATGNLARSQQLLSEAAALCDSQLPPQSASKVMVLVSEGEFAQTLGDDALGESKFLEALKILDATQTKENQDSNDEQYFNIVNKLGGLYRHWGYLDDAQYRFVQAAGYRKRKYGPNSGEYGSVLINIADVSEALGMRGRAAQHFALGMPILEKVAANSPALMDARSEYAGFLTAAQQYAAAIALLLPVRDYHAAHSGNKSGAYLATTSDLAMTYSLAGDYNHARPLFHELIQHQLYQVNNFFPALSEAEKGLFYKRAYADINAYNAFALRDPAEAGRMLDVQLNTKGLLFRSTQKVKELLLSSADDSIKAKYQRWQEIKTFLGKTYQLSAEEQRAAGVDEKAWEAKAKQLERTLTQQSERFASLLIKTPVWQDIQKQLKPGEASVEIVKVIEPHYEDVFSYMGKGLVYDSLANGEWVVYDVSPGKSAAAKAGINTGDFIIAINGKTVKGLTIAGVKKLMDTPEATILLSSNTGKNYTCTLRQDSVFTRMMVRQTRYAALILTATSKAGPRLVVLENGDALEDRYGRFYQNAIRQQLQDTYSYNQFWKPIQDALTGITRVYYSPDGVYNFINPLTLYDPTEKKYLVDKLDVVFVNTTADLLRDISPKAVQNATLIGFPNYQRKGHKKATPNYSSDVDYRAMQADSASTRFMSGTQVSELPATRTEVNTIGEILQQARIPVTKWMTDAASEEQLKGMPAPGVLHLATHGFFMNELGEDQNTRSVGGVTVRKLNENPLLRSGLLLAGAGETILNGRQGQDAEDGILTAYEAMNLDLNGTALVVMSACETGLGKVRSGEGVYGLNRAFRSAGARSVVMSLWKVDDQATQELMTGFYQSWVNNKSAGTALRASQLKLKEKYPHPYFWGAFIAVGQ